MKLDLPLCGKGGINRYLQPGRKKRSGILSNLRIRNYTKNSPQSQSEAPVRRLGSLLSLEQDDPLAGAERYGSDFVPGSCGRTSLSDPGIVDFQPFAFPGERNSHALCGSIDIDNATAESALQDRPSNSIVRCQRFPEVLIPKGIIGNILIERGSRGE
jgi:hypothetical protein